MTALIIVLGILAVLALLAFMRLRIDAVYSGDGFKVDCYIGPSQIGLVPKSAKKSKKKPEKPKKKPGQKQKEQEKPKKGGTVELVKKLLPQIGETLRKFRKLLRVDILRVYYTAACDDPCKAALSFGYASAGLGALTPVLESLFRIKERDFRTAVSFEAAEPEVYIEARLSMAVWKLLYIAGDFGVFYLNANKNSGDGKNKKKSDNRKAE